MTVSSPSFHIHFLFALIFIVFSAACSSSSTVEYNLPECTANSNESTEIYLDTQLKIEIPSNHSTVHPYYNWVKHGDSLWYVGLYVTAGNVLHFDFFDIDKQALHKSIEISHPSLQSFGHFQFYGDTLLMVTEDPARIQLYTIKTDEVRSWNVSDLKESHDALKSRHWIFESFEHSHFPELLPNSKEILLTLYPVDYWTNNNKATIPHLAVLSLEKNQLTKVFGYAQGIYTQDNIEYPYVLSYPYKIKKDNSVYTSYPLNAYIYEWSLDSLGLKKQICAGSNEFTKLNAADAVWAYSEDGQLEINQLITSGSFGPIHWHEKLNKFSRIVSHPQSLKSDELLNSELSRSFSIQLFDSQMNLLEEKEVPSGYAWPKALAHPEGWLVVSFLEKNVDENYFKFAHLFKFKELSN